LVADVDTCGIDPHAGVSAIREECGGGGIFDGFGDEVEVGVDFAGVVDAGATAAADGLHGTRVWSTTHDYGAYAGLM
jgi:hypothetical protein